MKALRPRCFPKEMSGLQRRPKLNPPSHKSFPFHQSQFRLLLHDDPPPLHTRLLNQHEEILTIRQTRQIETKALQRARRRAPLLKYLTPHHIVKLKFHLPRHDRESGACSGRKEKSPLAKFEWTFLVLAIPVMATAVLADLNRIPYWQPSRSRRNDREQVIACRAR